MQRNLVLSTAVIFTILNSVWATSVRRMSFDDLVKTAHSIVVGDVVGSRTYRSADGKLILTSYSINVQETLKGGAAQTVTVTTIGGRIGDTILHVSGMPVFESGEKAILFLEDSKSYTTVVGLNQGKFSVSNGEVSNSMIGLSFPDGLSNKPIKMPLDEFKRQIQLRITH